MSDHLALSNQATLDAAYQYCLLNPDETTVDFLRLPYQAAGVQNRTQRLSSKAILFNSLQGHSNAGEFIALIEAIQTLAGKNNSAWGYKVNGRSQWWEFYVGTPLKPFRSNALMHDLQTLLPPALTLSTSRNLPGNAIGLAFTLHHDSFTTSRHQPVYFYTSQDPWGQHVDTGTSYKLLNNTLQLENYYHWYKPTSVKELRHLEHMVSISPFFQPGKKNLAQVLIPEYLGCHRISYARKPLCDGIYFNRINIDLLMHFIEQFGIGENIFDFIGLHKEKLDHLLLDTGFDYQFINGQLHISKQAIYGGF